MHQEKPLIGMNADFRAASGPSPSFSYLAAGYYDKVLEAGGIPIILPPMGDDLDLSIALDRLDGVLLVGGQDLDPRRDGFMLHPSVRTLEPRRESFDRRLLRLVAERRMPVFGIGVGMQLLNLLMGGNLYLHIPDDLPDAIAHKDPQDPDHRHGLSVTAGTLMERVYGEGEIRVNSRHHMAIDEVAPGFIVSARCPDGVIEAIESDNEDWLALGTQFHPESGSASALDIRIFEEFIDGIRNRVGLRMVA